MKLIGYICEKCGTKEGIPDYGYEEPVNRLIMHIEKGWFITNKKCLCKNCIPEELSVNDRMHPVRINFNACTAEHERTAYPEMYDPYYSHSVLHELCDNCQHLSIELEVDGSTYKTCRAGDDGRGLFAHNLYSGHTCGGAVTGRCCHYFKSDQGYDGRSYCPSGRDPKKECEECRFEEPYDEIYDWD